MFSLFRTSPGPTPQQRLYEQIVAQARQPWLYSEAGVPDTLEGRFDMIVLHAFLLFDRLGADGGAGRELSQAVFEEMFTDMDRSLREMGVGDLSVGRRIRTMAEIFYGRSQMYAQALQQPGEDGRQALAAVLARNVFSGEGGDAAALADYVAAEQRALAARPVAMLLAGESGFGLATAASREEAHEP